ncbi:hypothetical protein [Patiriisocius marinistellae]|uniref:hypothetical protein n=1 Tax=Patiriisocius marinistellae TaxID=2494560 RepID=UPI00125E872D|nr:hypothetical protein [Patiriisocius marinistellae]
MKIFIYILLLLSAGMLIYNLTNINWDAPFVGESTVAAICTMAAACVLVMLAILLVSRKIASVKK